MRPLKLGRANPSITAISTITTIISMSVKPRSDAQNPLFSMSCHPLRASACRRALLPDFNWCEFYFFDFPVTDQ